MREKDKNLKNNFPIILPSLSRVPNFDGYTSVIFKIYKKFLILTQSALH